MLERHAEAAEYAEYCAALGAWATLTVHRSKHASVRPVSTYMFLSNARKQGTQAQPQTRRYAQPGERPPSRRPGPDRVIERFDAWAQAELNRK